jgi:hypothetical protein
MKNKSIIGGACILYSLSILNACAPERKDSIKSLKWMLGKWESHSADGVLIEEWTKANDSTFIGHAISISNDGDTTFSEISNIKERAGTITYELAVNEIDTAEFVMTQNDSSSVFENEDNDYPKLIVYKKQGKDSLYAKIEGEVDGSNSKEEFTYVKIKKKSSIF